MYTYAHVYVYIPMHIHNLHFHIYKRLELSHTLVPSKTDQGIDERGKQD